MKVVYITGTSRGLGKALAEQYLKKGDTVVGMSRSSSINHPNYQHISIDLSDIDSLEKVVFRPTEDAESYILINNAGTLGEVKHVGDLDSLMIARSVALNITAPMVLTNKFVGALCNEKADKYVLNIGSGAGSSAIDGWSVYCSSKAAINMFGAVFDKELMLKDSNCKVRTLAPGIIDTKMQSEIRQASIEHFSERKRFENYKNNNELSSAREVSSKIISNFDRIYKKEDSVQSIRSYS
ncbi:MAG: SDR family NAD(P)-dependent oxidoreductase [Vicingaceae bacterium]